MLNGCYNEYKTLRRWAVTIAVGWYQALTYHQQLRENDVNHFCSNNDPHRSHIYCCTNFQWLQHGPYDLFVKQQMIHSALRFIKVWFLINPICIIFRAKNYRIILCAISDPITFVQIMIDISFNHFTVKIFQWPQYGPNGRFVKHYMIHISYRYITVKIWKNGMDHFLNMKWSDHVLKKT